MSLDMTKYTKSEWIHGEDLPIGQPIEATIQKVYEHVFERDNVTRPVVEYFELDGKQSLNKTQTKMLVAMFGPDASAWIGQRVTLTAVMNGGYQGKPTIAIGRGQPLAVPTANGQPIYQAPPQPVYQAAPQPGPATTYQAPPQPAQPVYQTAPQHGEVVFQTGA